MLRANGVVKRFCSHQKLTETASQRRAAPVRTRPARKRGKKTAEEGSEGGAGEGPRD